MLTSVPAPVAQWSDGCRVAFSIGGLPIMWYGIFVTVGFILAIALAGIKIAVWYKIKTDPLFYFCLILIPVSIFGARLWSCCIGNTEWHEFINFRKGGLAVEGGVILALLAAIIYFPLILKSNKYKIRDIKTDPNDPQVRQVSAWVYLDAIVPCILIGQILGRWGNYFNQEVYGMAISEDQTAYLTWLSTNLPYMYVAGLNAYAQPLFLYESCANIVGLALIYVAMEYIPKVKCGSLTISYFLWYGIVRAIMEPLRYSNYKYVGTYVMTGIWIVAALILLILNQVNVISKTRNYACILIIWDKTFGELHRIDYKSRVERLEWKHTQLIQNNAPKEEIDTLNNKLISTKQHYESLMSKHLVRKSNYKRVGNQILYYNGR
ncbi:MAG: prolipoprotein diacylglyceryl transferase [Malacoplasma sp.]|nr:prolipoprotein diacylglyceryl transferase [Malacoplasma sp.]